ncbi:Hypothetical protein A7982_03328 [Minicystis rosea]|nr:Hypothetical protein A7982_03328 [Minicystis rosea]
MTNDTALLHIDHCDGPLVKNSLHESTAPRRPIRTEHRKAISGRRPAMRRGALQSDDRWAVVPNTWQATGHVDATTPAMLDDESASLGDRARPPAKEIPDQRVVPAPCIIGLPPHLTWRAVEKRLCSPIVRGSM